MVLGGGAELDPSSAGVGFDIGPGGMGGAGAGAANDGARGMSADTFTIP